MTSFATERLHLRPRTPADLESCLAMDRDPAVARFVAGPWDDPAAHRAFVLARMNEVYPEGLGYWSVFGRDSPRDFLGWILLLPDMTPDGGVRLGSVEIGWRFARHGRERGYATEAAAVVLEHALSLSGVEHVVADIDPSNVASIGVARKIGMSVVNDGASGGVEQLSYHALRAPGR